MNIDLQAHIRTKMNSDELLARLDKTSELLRAFHWPETALFFLAHMMHDEDIMNQKPCDAEMNMV
jgi:hypothetical protein